MKIESHDLFKLNGESYECIGTDDGYVWYEKDGEMDAVKAEHDDCELTHRWVGNLRPEIEIYDFGIKMAEIVYKDRVTKTAEWVCDEAWNMLNGFIANMMPGVKREFDKWRKKTLLSIPIPEIKTSIAEEIWDSGFDFGFDCGREPDKESKHLSKGEFLPSFSINNKTQK